MIGIEAKISGALMDRLATLPAQLGPAGETMRVAKPNRPFKPNGEAHFRASFLPARPAQATMGVTGYNWHTGVFQVSVYWPENLGLVDPLERAAAVAAHFKLGTDLEREGVFVRIDVPPYIGALLTEPGFIYLPVSIEYQAWTPQP